ncbi:MAG: hypothetical protein KGJ86_10550, partial [Chloroflexota bacterium]|nr:hypothetical protein [Chloroflexota bacterium]
SHLLHPAILKYGLIPAVQELADSFGAFFQVTLQANEELRSRDMLKGDGIEAGARLVAYRVVEEGLNNAAKHSHARSVAIALDLLDDVLDVSVTDDGVGLNRATVRPGLGLDGLAGRLEYRGGTVRLEGAVGGGARLIARLPLTGLTLQDILAPAGFDLAGSE